MRPYAQKLDRFKTAAHYHIRNGNPMHKRARKIMKRTKDHEHNLKRICTEIQYDFEKMTGHTRKNGMT